ncbi:hypothetical protein [Aureivirga sp. CE67]|uniref:hypothetical protein n=1 Tax=Aureivirga sp. CE67 TaxID=1788983 RepID=UPI0018C9DE5D|nr:hypothetical protein [Aureivirga sp. CE67]
MTKKTFTKIIIFLFPILLFAEYNGVEIHFQIHFKNGETVEGYRFLANGKNTDEYKSYLEQNPKLFLKNELVTEPGEYCYYAKRLKYVYNKNLYVYKHLEPMAIVLEKVDKVEILDLERKSYTTGLSGNYTSEDQVWMNTKPFAQYAYGKDMCSFEVFIHDAGNVPDEVKSEIKELLVKFNYRIENRIQEIEDMVQSDEEFEKKMRGVYEEREKLLKPYFEKYKSLKTATVTMCTC